LFSIHAKNVLTKRMYNLFYMMHLNIQWSLYYDLVHIYFIKFYNEKVILNIISNIKFLKIYSLLLYFIFLQILYSTYHKFNEMHNDFIMKLKYILKIFGTLIK
jgi:hypothetical protein